MHFKEFEQLAPQDVQYLLATRPPLGVAIPFNGTRRWYLKTANLSASELANYYQDYAQRTLARMYEIVTMMFDDGVTTVYTPLFGRDLEERGQFYVQMMLNSLLLLASPDSIQWAKMNNVSAGCYGDLTCLPNKVAEQVYQLTSETALPSVKHYIRYGVYADDGFNSDLIQRVFDLKKQLGSAPSERQLVEYYYNAPYIPASMWIGADQPTIFDVPLIVSGRTALYFLQFPTPYMDRNLWRRILYDYIYVRGDEETLYPDNIQEQRFVTGLGVRSAGHWKPSLM